MRIAVILSRFPYPLEKGDKLRAFQHIKALSLNHEVNLFCLSDETPSEKGLEIISKIVNQLRVYKLSKSTIVKNLIFSFLRKLPLQVGYFYNKSIQQRMINDIDKSNSDIVYCQLIRTALYANQLNCQKVIDFQDAFSVGTEQRLKRAHWTLKWLFKRELRLVKGFEHRIFEQFDHHMVISEQDRDEINHAKNNQISIMPNGLDTDYFNNENKVKASSILFVGNMNYTPNIDAATFLINDVMPLVWSKYNDLKVSIAGANPSSAVLQLASKNVIVTGWVDDIRQEYEKARIFVAPMRIGTGVQNKLMEAMAMEIPSITTSISAQPLGVKNGRDLIVANSATEIADSIIKLIDDKKLHSEVGSSGRVFILDHFSLKRSSKKLTDFFEQINIDL